MVKKKIKKVNLNLIRKQIDEVDNSILKLLSKRANLVVEAGESKKDIGDTSYYKPDREAKIINSLILKNKSRLNQKHIKNIYKEIISACFSLEKKIEVFFLGPQGTYSELAAIDHFGRSAKRVSCSDIAQIFTKINEENSFGIVPVENSSEGSVNQTLDCLQSQNLIICGELELPIKHALLSQSNNLKKIATICGHEQALSQCKLWLGKNLPNVKLISVESSGVAIENAKKSKTIAAIAHASNSKEFKLKILKRNIEDQKNNTTRFLVVGKINAKKSGKDKTSILISLDNKPGALSKVLKVFESSKINLSHIQSRPNKSDKWQYSFFLDFEGHLEDAKVKGLMKKLSSVTQSLKFLGSYPISL
tara:strand:- start:686 stop:1774 length:1089 start_codon:yes stop_codon:yes gene_type:complete